MTMVITQISITGKVLGPNETLIIYPIDVFKDGRYELDEFIQLELFPAEGETAVQTGDPAIVLLQDSDGEYICNVHVS